MSHLIWNYFVIFFDYLFILIIINEPGLVLVEP